MALYSDLILARPKNTVPSGYTQVYYDPKTGQYMQPNPTFNASFHAFGIGQKVPQYVPINPGGTTGATAYTPPSFDFNSLPQQTIAQAQPYVRPNAPAQNTGSDYRPQFDPTFIQQMLAQRFGMQQPNAGIPTVAQVNPLQPQSAGIAGLPQANQPAVARPTIMVGTE